LGSVDPIAALEGITVSGGRLNATDALVPLQPGSITGIVWDDADNNGIRASSELGLSGLTVYLDTNRNGTFDSGEDSQITDGNGQYTFTNVSPGSYQISQVVPAGFTQTAPMFADDYIWSDSNSVGGPAYNWFDISSVGTKLSLAHDDAFVEVTLPFAFDFYGETETSVKIGDNGYLTFGSDGIDWSNDPIPNATDPDAIIAPFWDDLNPARGGDIFHYSDTVNNRFIVEYDGMMRWGGGAGNYTFQAILNGDGSIEFQYNSMNGELESATTGIENHAGNDGVQIAYNSDYVQGGLAVRISEASSTPTFNSVTVRSGQSVTGADFGNHKLGNELPTGSVTISGTAIEDATLTAASTLDDADGLGALSYQWNRDGSAISGATSGTYVLTQDDVGSTVTVTVSYTDGEGTEESVTSVATSAVANVNE
jgi:hypothetical protein